MKVLELTDQKARDLNDIFDFAVKHGFNEWFDISFYHRKVCPDTDILYLRHLISVATQYNFDKQKIIFIDGLTLAASHNTEPFLKSDGFLRLLQLEQREDRIQDFTLRHLQQSIFATKDWWILFIFTTLATVGVTKLTTSSKEEKTTSQAPIQDSTKPVTKTNPYHLDTSNSSKQVLQSDTATKDK